MSKLSLKFEMIEVDARTRRPLPGVIHEVEIEADELDPNDLDGSLRENLPDLDRQARNAVAARRVDYDRFDGDSEYLNAVDRAAGDYYTVSAGVEGAAVKNYSVEGIYPGEGGIWEDVVGAVNSSEATFQGAWTMAENAYGSIESRIDPDMTSERMLEDHLASMEDQRITNVDISRPGRDEAFQALNGLCAAARAAGVKDDALAVAERLLASDWLAREASESDGIQYNESAAAPAP